MFFKIIKWIDHPIVEVTREEWKGLIPLGLNEKQHFSGKLCHQGQAFNFSCLNFPVCKMGTP